MSLCDPVDCSTPCSCLRLIPRVCSDSCSLSRWCYLTISSSATPFSFCFQSFPASQSFPVSQFFTLGGQSTGVSSSASNEYSGFPLGWTGWISLLSKGLSRVFFNTTFQKHQFFGAQPSAMGFPGGSDSKESACSAEHPGSVPGLERSLSRGNDSPL